MEMEEGAKAGRGWGGSRGAFWEKQDWQEEVVGARTQGSSEPVQRSHSFVKSSDFQLCLLKHSFFKIKS